MTGKFKMSPGKTIAADVIESFGLPEPDGKGIITFTKNHEANLWRLGIYNKEQLLEKLGLEPIKSEDKGGDG